MQTTAATPVSVVNPCEAAHIAGEDYEITTANSLYQWRGLDSGHGYESYFSDGEGWQTPEAAQCDALYCLNCLDGLGHADAMAELTAWRFFTPEVLKNCDRENAESFDFSDLEAEEEAPLNASQIRDELEKLAEEGNVTPDDYIRLYRAWQTIKEDMPRSYYPVIVDRLNNLLATVIPMEGNAAEISALARAMNSTDLMLDDLKAIRQRRSY